MISEEFLKLLVCPESRQALQVANQSMVDDLNRQIREGTLVNRSGQKVEQLLDGGLIREDGRVCYSVIDDIPVLLSDEGIEVVPSADEQSN